MSIYAKSEKQSHIGMKSPGQPGPQIEQLDKPKALKNFSDKHIQTDEDFKVL